MSLIMKKGSTPLCDLRYKLMKEIKERKNPDEVAYIVEPTLLDVKWCDIIIHKVTEKKYLAKDAYTGDDGNDILILEEWGGDNEKIEIRFDELDVETWSMFKKNTVYTEIFWRPRVHHGLLVKFF